ncbi:class C sortase [Propionicicella superfundia]|uniref:class C sortase n=1 Tax=Propionicicella superfundia TaxID=348582 RepID=UPI00041FD6D8|nr:class C sortase [Propionicicella superfundia]
MTMTVETPRPEAPAARSGWRRLIGPWSRLRSLVVAFAVGGALVLSYPVAAQWFSDAAHAAEVTGYAHVAEQVPEAERAQRLAEARAFNALLPYGPLRDPYALNADGSPVDVSAGRAAYEGLLDLGRDGTMGTISIPAIGAALPILHDTDAAALDAGVGHLFGSSLPVGGESTHAVLTAHSGMVSQTLFTNLNQVKVGDTFTIRVLDEVLTYQVDQLLTVEPDDLRALQRTPGRDYVTLVTCTPIGINTHRLLVRGVRVPTPAQAAGDGQIGGVPGPGFPWWVFPLPLALLLAVVATRPPRRSAASRPAGAVRRDDEPPEQDLVSGQDPEEGLPAGEPASANTGQADSRWQRQYEKEE